MCAYDPATGKPLWRSRAAQPARAVEANGVLHLDGGRFLDAATGRQFGRLPAATDSTRLVAVGAGQVLSVDAAAHVLSVYGL